MQDEHGIMARAIPFSGLRTTLFVVKGNKMSLEMAQRRMDHPCRQDGEKKFNQLKELLLNFFISELTELEYDYGSLLSSKYSRFPHCIAIVN